MTVHQGNLRNLIFVAFAVLLAGAALLSISGLTVTWGDRIPQENLQADYWAAVICALLIGMSIFAWPVRNDEKPALVLAWFAKAIVVLIVMLPYEWHYELDCFGYFAWSRVPAPALENGDFPQGRELVIAIARFVDRIVDSYHTEKLIFALFGFVAVYLFYRAGMALSGRDSEPRALLALALFPSIIFWSSILGKDPIVFLGMGLYAWGVAWWSRSHRFRYLLAIGAGVFLASAVRSWMGIILLLPLLAFVLRGARTMFSKVVLAGLGCAAFFLLLQRFAEGMGIASTGDIPAVTDYIARSWSYGGSGHEIATEFTSIGMMLAFMPAGIITVLFRPLPGEVMNMFGLLSGLENLFLVVLAFRTLRRLMTPAGRAAIRGDAVVYWGVLLIITWSSIYGFVSYQNLGASVRFRLSILPIVLGLHWYIAARVRQMALKTRVTRAVPVVALPVPAMGTSQ